MTAPAAPEVPDAWTRMDFLLCANAASLSWRTQGAALRRALAANGPTLDTVATPGSALERLLAAARAAAEAGGHPLPEILATLGSAAIGYGAALSAEMNAGDGPPIQPRYPWMDRSDLQ